MSLFKDYARFLKEEKLLELTELQLSILTKMDIPLMRYVENLTHEQMIESGKQGLYIFLDAVVNDTVEEYLKLSLDNWEKGNLEGDIPREAINPSDLILIYSGQEKALIQLIPQYTQDIEKMMLLIDEISDFYINAEEKAFNVLFKIRKESEDALKESEERFRTMSQTAADGIIITNGEKKIVFWNRAAENLFGYEFEDVKLKPIENFFDKDGAALSTILSNINENKDNVVAITNEFVVLAKGDVKIFTDISASYYNTSKEKFYCFIIHDITQRKHIEELLNAKSLELERSNHYLEQFAYVASHDMREPLRMITSFLQLLSRKYNDSLPDEAKNYIGMAQDGAYRLGSLITNILNYSKVNSTALELSKVDLEDVVLEVKRNLGALLEEREVEIHYSDLPTLKVDRVKMVQLFQNLISNGIKFNTGNPVITISASDHPDYTEVQIKDNGIGMSKEQIGQSFVMFKRLHGKEFPGTGIGLALCKRIVEQHEGDIWIDSIENEGTTFHFTLKKDL